MQMAAKLTPHQARTQLGLSCQEVADKSGLAVTTIYRIESNEAEYGINETAAEVLAECLGVPFDSMIWPRPLSNRGRPPLTGRPKQVCIRRQPAIKNEEGQLCSSCQIVQVPINNRCACCGY